MNLAILMSSVPRCGGETLFTVDFHESNGDQPGTHCWSYSDRMFVRTALDVDGDQNAAMETHSKVVAKVRDELRLNPDRWKHSLNGGLYVNVAYEGGVTG